MKIKAPQLLIITGSILLLVAGVSIIYNLVDDYRAGQRAQLILEELQQLPSPAGFDTPGDTSVINNVASVIPAEATGDNEELAPGQPENAGEPEPAASASQPRRNYDTVGVLSIARFNLSLPVLSECTDSLLKVSVCRYAGDAADKPRRLIVAGHNYKSHFGRISKLEIGDQVYFTTKEGQKYSYAVSEVTEIAADDHYGLGQGEWDIILFTCTPGGSRRVVARCLELPEEAPNLEAAPHPEEAPNQEEAPHPEEAPNQEEALNPEMSPAQ